MAQLGEEFLGRDFGGKEHQNKKKENVEKSTLKVHLASCANASLHSCFIVYGHALVLAVFPMFQNHLFVLLTSKLMYEP